MKEHLHWSYQVSITSMISAILVGVIVLAGWTVTGAQWIRTTLALALQAVEPHIQLYNPIS